MQNPFQQAGSNPLDGLNDPLAFVKKLWGDMQLPGMVTPTISVDELDKQIKDLKTVESWLNVNMTMLRGTIHALEVQRSTIAALKTMGESFAQTTAAHAPKASSANTKQAAHDTPKNTNWPMPEQAPPTPTANPEVEKTPSQEKPTNQAQTTFDNPAAWWTVLQDQFKAALSTALKEEAKPSASPSKDKKPASASKPSASAKKPAAKTSAAKKPSKVSASTAKKPSARAKT